MADQQFSEYRQKVPALVRIISLLMLLLGIGSLFTLVALFSISLLAGRPGLFIDLLFSVAGLGLAEGVAFGVVSFGIRRMRRWGLYAFTLLTAWGFLEWTYLLVTASEVDFPTMIGRVIQVLFLIYLWKISKRFIAQPLQPFLHRWLPTIVGVVIVAFGVGGFFLFQVLIKSSEETKAPAQEISTEVWKLYTDSPFGNNAFDGSVPGYSLSLRIPPNFKENEGEGLFFYTGKSFSIVGEDENKASTVEFQVVPSSLGGEEYKKLIIKLRNMLPGATTEVDSVSILKIADIDLPFCVGPQILIEGAGNSPDMFEYQTLCSLSDDLGSTTLVFILRARRNHIEDMDKYKPLYDTVLSTFRYENWVTKAGQDETANWKTYRNEEFGFEVKYPPGGEVTKTSYGPRIILPIEEEGTNLIEKYLDIAVDGPSAHTGNLVSREQVFLGGKLFIKEDRSGVAAGNTYDTEFYITNHRGKEYNISFTLHFGNIGNYDPSIRPKVFDRDQEKKVFDQILSTFKFFK